MRSILIHTAALAIMLAGGCSSANSNKDTVSQTNRPPDPGPGTSSEAPARGKKERPIESPSEEPRPANGRPAGENSEFTTVMNEDGSISEIRTFKEHPQIVRAEVNWTEPADKRLKLQLTAGGRSRTLKVSENFDLRRATVEELLSGRNASAANDSNAERPRFVKGK